MSDKLVVFEGNTLSAIKSFTKEAKREAGYQIDLIQKGFDPNDWKPLNTVGQGVREIRIHVDGQYRVIYIAKFNNAIYILHAFQKKDQKTRQSDIEIAKKAYKDVKNRCKEAKF